MKMINIRVLYSTLLLGAGVFTASMQTQAADSNDKALKLLEEVIVTARIREEGLQDAPLAVSAYTGESLEYRGVNKLDDIARFVPSLTLENNPSFGGASNAAAIYLRGVGQKEFLPTTEPGVGLYVDGVYVARSVGGILDIVDVERLEVLRGPQGTLFGRNTIGGAISLTSVRPEPGGERSAKVSVATGTDNLSRLKGAVHVPLSDTFAARLSVASSRQDGYVQRTDGVDLGDDDTLTGRLSLAWQLSDDFSADFSLDMTRDRENGPALQLIGIDYSDLSQLSNVNGGPLDPGSVPPPMAFIHNVVFAATGPGLPCAASAIGITSAPASPNCYDDRYIGADNQDEGSAPAFSETDVLGVSATLSYAISEALSLKSITAYRELDAKFARDGDHSPHRISQFFDDLEQAQFSQEFQLLGSHDRVNWVLGLYYFEEDGDNENILDFTVSNFRSGGEFDNEALAAFAQVTFDVSDRLHLTVGGRYTDEEKSFTPDQIIFQNYITDFFGAIPAPLPGDLAALGAPFLEAGDRILPFIEKTVDIEEFTPMVNWAFDVSDDAMLYLTYSEGFKSGGFTQRVFPPIVAPFTAPAGTPDLDLIPTYEPEFVESVEFGAKMSFHEGRIKLNGALFQSDYKDLQVQVFNSVAPVTQNVGTATIDGVELELKAAPGDGWFVEASVSFIDAEYVDIDTASTLIGKDNDFERVPDTQASIGVSKAIELEDSGSITLRGDWSYRGATYNDAYNTELLKTNSYDLFDASIAWTNQDEDLTVTLLGRNLGDEQYLVSGVYGTAFQSFEGLYDRGRQWQLEVRARF